MNKRIFTGTPIYFISEEEASEIIEAWEEDHSLNNNLYIAIDNTEGDCWVEQFRTLNGAIGWLLHDEEDTQ